MNSKTAKIARTSVLSLAPLLSAGSAQASVVHYTGSATESNYGSPHTSVYWDIDKNGGSDYEVIFSFQNSTQFVPNLNAASFLEIYTHSVGNKLLALADGAVVSTGRNFAKNTSIIAVTISGAAWGLSGFSSGASKYIGFRFTNSGSVYYGWALITFYYNGSNTNATYVTIGEWAYESIAGNSIIVGDTGAVPEPAQTAVGLGALALGAAGLRRWRKAKAAKAA